MKYTFLFSALMALSTFGFAQTLQRDSVEIKGNRYYSDGQRLNVKGLSNLVRLDPEAAAVMRKATVNYQAASFLGALGIVLPIFPLSDQISGSDPNWNLAIAGGISIAAAVLLNNSRHKRTAEAIQIYHRNLAGSNVTGAGHTQELGVFVRF